MTFPTFASLGTAGFLSVILVMVLAVIGWIMNIIKIVGAIADPVTAMFILRCVGIIVAPLGAILGWVPA